jgi:putative oxidoreductase
MCCMRALNSNYPNSWQGAGLFLLRLALGCSSISVAALQLLAGVMLLGEVVLLVQIVSAGLLVLGLCTPIVGIILAVVELEGAIVYADHLALTDLLLAAIAVTLVMTGPGAWSIDARLFGRRRIDVAPRGD